MNVRSVPTVGLREVGLTRSETPWSMNPAENARPRAERRIMVKLVSCSVAGRGVVKPISLRAERSDIRTVRSWRTVNWGSTTRRSAAFPVNEKKSPIAR